MRRDCRWLQAVGVWALLLAPLVLYGYVVFHFSYNVPVQDDYAMLEYLDAHHAAAGVEDQVRLLLSQHLEHRIVLTRGAFLGQWRLLGEVNFRQAMLFGNAGMVLCVLVLLYVGVRRLNLPPRYLLPIPFALLAFTHQENMFWAMASIQNYWALLLAVVCVVLLSGRAPWLATPVAAVAILSSGSGLPLLPLGVGSLLFRRRWVSAAVFAMGAGAAAYVCLVAFVPVPEHPKLSGGPLDIALRAVPYFLAFLGGIGGWVPLAIGIGTILSAALAVCVVRPRGCGVLALLAGYVLLTAGAASAVRAGFGVEQALSSRYTMYSILGCVVAYLWVVSSLAGQWKRNVVAAMAVAGAMALFCVHAFPLLRNDTFSMARAYQLNTLAAWQRGRAFELSFGPLGNREWFLRGKAILDRAAELGTYDGPDASELCQPVRVSLPPPTDNTGLMYAIDWYPRVRLAGWAVIPGMRSSKVATYVVLSSERGAWRLNTFRLPRPDISEILGRPGRYDWSGFDAFLDSFHVPPGTYEIGLLLVSRRRTAYRPLGLVYTVPDLPISAGGR